VSKSIICEGTKENIKNWKGRVYLHCWMSPKQPGYISNKYFSNFWQISSLVYIEISFNISWGYIKHFERISIFNFLIFLTVHNNFVKY
jgi:hypothetical protein